jgi:hypothetical protein
MDDLLAPFEPDRIAPEPVVPQTYPMTPAQRSEIRDLFRLLEIADARTQFGVVHELTGVRIAAVTELTASQAHTLIARLENRVSRRNLPAGGSAWDNREEDTWIDRL